MSKEVNWFKQPDWDYLKEKYPNEWKSLKRYWYAGCHYAVVACRKFNDKELDVIKECVVVSSQYGLSVRFILEDGFKDVPASRNLDANIGDRIPADRLYLLTLTRTFEDDDFLYRVTTIPEDVSCDITEAKEYHKRMTEIIQTEDTFRGCLRLY